MPGHDPVIRNDPRAGDVSTLIHALGLRAGSLTSDETIYEAVADGMSQLLGIDRTDIFMMQGDSERMSPVFRRGAALTDEIMGTLLGPLLKRSMTSNRAFLDTIDTASITSPAGRESMPFEEQVAVCPVMIDDRHVGAMAITSQGEAPLSETDLWIVETISMLLGLMLANRKRAGLEQERWTDDALLRELARHRASRSEPGQILVYAAQYLGSSIDCDVLFMRREDGAWTTDEPFVRDLADLRARRSLLDRLRSIEPSIQRPFRDAESDPIGPRRADRNPDGLEAYINEELEKEELFQSVIFSNSSSAAEPLVLIALRSGSPERDFSDEERARIERTMRFVTPALVISSLTMEFARALREREAIHRMTTAMGAGRTTTERIRIACRTAQLLFSCDYVALTDWTVQPPGLRFVVGSITSEPVVLSRPGTITAVRRSGDVRIINDFPTDPPVKVDWYPLHAAERLRASLTFRLQWSGTMFGSLILGFRRPRHFSGADLRFAESMAHAIVGSLGPELNIVDHREPPSSPG